MRYQRSTYWYPHKYDVDWTSRHKWWKLFKIEKLLKSYSQDELCDPKKTDSPQTTKSSKYRPFDVSSLMRKSPEKSPQRQSQSPSSPELTVGVYMCQHWVSQIWCTAFTNFQMLSCRLEPLTILLLLLPPSTPILDSTTSYLEVHTCLNYKHCHRQNVTSHHTCYHQITRYPCIMFDHQITHDLLLLQFSFTCIAFT